MNTEIDVLIPTCDRPGPLAVTLAGLCAQNFKNFKVIISNQSEKTEILRHKEIKTVLRVLELHGNKTIVLRHLPKKGIAENRHFLLGNSSSKYALFLDDDLFLEKDMIERMLKAIKEENCGFVGAAPIGLSYREEERPREQSIDFWTENVKPEQVKPFGEKWNRHLLHNAANIYHVQKKLNLSAKNQKKYKIAWVGGCVLYDADKLKKTGGYGFWKDLPCEHCGEDVLAQLKVMAEYGGCGLIPSGVYHLEVPTTIVNRRFNAPEILNYAR